MLRELIAIFRDDSNPPLTAMGADFEKMLELAIDNTHAAGEIFFRQNQPSPAERTDLCNKDIEVNQLERSVRKQVATHLSFAHTRADVPYGLLLMSLVKDVERIGDYAKNISEIRDLHPGSLADDELVAELREIARETETALSVSLEIFRSSDDEAALRRMRAGRDIVHRSDALIQRICESPYNAAEAVALVLGTRFYRRIAAHVQNILSSVLMPLHKIDYYDEDALTNDVAAAAADS